MPIEGNAAIVETTEKAPQLVVKENSEFVPDQENRATGGTTTEVPHLIFDHKSDPIDKGTCLI